MFDTTDGVIRALRTLGRSSETRSTSILSRSGAGYSVDRDPFHGGFIDSIDTRTELLKRFARLDERERAILTLWYVQDLEVPAICETLGMSRATAYRIRDRAIERMTGASTTTEAAALV